MESPGWLVADRMGCSHPAKGIRGPRWPPPSPGGSRTNQAGRLARCGWGKRENTCRGGKELWALWWQPICACGGLCLRRFLDLTSQYPSVPKSNRLHVDIFRFPFIKLWFIL